MSRELTEYRIEISPVDFDETKDLCQWLVEHAGKTLHYLLAHAIDGVIWGAIEGGILYTSNEIDDKISPELRIETLQQLRLFNEDHEIYLWHDGEVWKAQEVTECQDENYAMIKEHHILWGTQGIEINRFTLLEDGSQGLKHIVPIDASSVNEKSKRARLCVHHYLDEDEKGVNYIAYSRLAGIEVR